MSRLMDMSESKEKLTNRLLSSVGLCKALQYNDANFLDQPNVEQPKELIHRKLFPYKYIPDPAAEKSTFITMSFRKFYVVNNAFRSGFVYFNVFTHKELHSTASRMLRCDYIVAEIDRLLQGFSGIGFSKLQFAEMDELSVNEDYSGMYIAYKLWELN